MAYKSLFAAQPVDKIVQPVTKQSSGYVSMFVNQTKQPVAPKTGASSDQPAPSITLDQSVTPIKATQSKPLSTLLRRTPTTSPTSLTALATPTDQQNANPVLFPKQTLRETANAAETARQAIAPKPINSPILQAVKNTEDFLQDRAHTSGLADKSFIDGVTATVMNQGAQIANTASSQIAKSVDFLYNYIDANPSAVLLGPMSKLLPKDNFIDAKARKAREESQKSGTDTIRQSLAQWKKDTTDASADTSVESEAWKNSTTSEKLTKHLPETIYNLAPSIAGSILPYLVSGPVGFITAAGSTADDVKQQAIQAGADPQHAENLGLGTGLAVGLLDRIVPDKIFSKGEKAVFVKGFTKRLLKFTSEAGQSSLIEGATEGVQEAMQMLAESTFRSIGWDEVKTREAMSVFGGILGGSGMHGVHGLLSIATSPDAKESSTNQIQNNQNTVVTPPLKTEESMKQTSKTVPSLFSESKNIVQPFRASTITPAADAKINVKDVYTMSASELKGVGTRMDVTPEQISQARDAIANGTMQPIEIERLPNGNIWLKDGSHRLSAMKAAGIKEIPVVDTSPSNNSLNGPTLPTSPLRVGGEQVALVKPISALQEDAPSGKIIETAGKINEPISPRLPAQHVAPIALTPADVATSFERKSKIPTVPIKKIELKDTELHNKIMTELTYAQAGQRIMTRDAGSGERRFSASKSTFPSWIPSELRHKALLDAVSKHISNGTIPTNTAEARLYRIVANEMEAQNEVINDVAFIAEQRRDLTSPFNTDEENAQILAKFDTEYAKLKANQNGITDTSGGTFQTVGATVQEATQPTQEASPQKPVTAGKIDIGELIQNVDRNTTGRFDRNPKVVVELPKHISEIIGLKDGRVYLSEFVIAKIKGKIPELNGHPEITDAMLQDLPTKLADPIEVLNDNRENTKKYLFINLGPMTEAVVEVERGPDGLTEINTFHRINEKELGRLEEKFPTIYKKESTLRDPLSPHASGVLSDGAGGGVSGLKADSLTERIPEISQSVKERLNSRVYDRLKAEDPNLKEEVTYAVQSLKDNAEKAVQMIENDRTEAYRIAMGVSEPPIGQTATAVNIALAEKALVDGNNTLYGQLTVQRSLAQTRRGQEIVAERGSVSDNSTSRYVKELVKARLDKLGKNYLGGLSPLSLKKNKGSRATTAIDAEVVKVREKIKSNKELDLDAAQSFLDSLACK